MPRSSASSSFPESKSATISLINSPVLNSSMHESAASFDKTRGAFLRDVLAAYHKG